MIDDCGKENALGDVTVTDSDVDLGKIEGADVCHVIIVGKMEREDPPSLG